MRRVSTRTSIASRFCCSVPVEMICQTGVHDLADLGLEVGEVAALLLARRGSSNGAHTAASSSALAVDVRPALVGQPQRAAAALVVGLDQALVLELRMVG